MALSRRGAWLAALAVLAAGAEPIPAGAHGTEPHGGAEAAPAAVAAPAAGAQAPPAPVPGSYALPPLGRAADGPVLDSDGRSTTLHALFGDAEVVLLSFVYTRCSDAAGCPLATAVLDEVVHRLRDAPDVAARLRLVTVSFDPARDTPEVMRRYGARLGGDGVDWRFATGVSEAALAPMLEAYGQTLVRAVDAAGAPAAISHILRVFLIDGARRIRNVYTVSFLHPETLVADVRTLLADPPPAPPPPPADGATAGPGDVRRGYAGAGYRTRSRSLAARRGEAADLLARLRRPRLGLPPVPGELPSAAQVALGRDLFYDRRLSRNGTLSCALCHVPEQGFTSNEQATPIGIEGRTVRRNAPTLLDVAYASALFHDGRESRLERQVWSPLLAADEMGNRSVDAVLDRVRAIDDYAVRFAAAFPERGLDEETLGAALAAYERTLVTGDSPFDRWRYGGEADAVGEDVRRGFALFTGRAGCSACHLVGDADAPFRDGGFHDTGIGFAAAAPPPAAPRTIQVAPGLTLTVDPEVIAPVSGPRPGDLGRYEVTGDPADRWRYRTPTLRNVARTAPYMHDGSLATLEAVVDYYDRGGTPHDGLDPRIRPLGLTARERADLVAFLRALTGGDLDVLIADAFAARIGDTGADAR